MYNLNLIQNNLFSICLSKNGGYLSLGKINDNLYYKNLNYINILSSSSLKNIFELKINSIEIGEEKIFQESISYIDSTNLFSYFPENIYNFIFQTLKKENKTDFFSYDYENNYCRIINDKITKNNLYEIFPNIIINFENYNFEWKSNNYIIESEIEENNIFKICLGIKKLSGNNEKIILGTNFMIGNDIIFDKTNQKIAFIQSDCEQIKSSIINNEINKNNSNTNENESNLISLSNELDVKNITINESKIKETFLETNEISHLITNEDYSDIYRNKNESNNSNEINENKLYSDFITNTFATDNLTNTITKEINNDTSDFTKDNKTDFINTNIELNKISTLINITNNNTLIAKTTNIIISNIKSTNTLIINSTINIMNIHESGSLNNTIIENINKSIIYTSNIIINSTINNNINITNIISSNLKTYIEKQKESVNLVNFSKNTTNIISSTIKNNKELESNFDSDIKITDQIFLSDNIISTAKNQEKQTESITNKNMITDIIDNEKTNNIINKNTTNSHINIEIEKNDELKDKTFMGNVFDIIKSFLKNKLIYFFLALLGVVLCFVVVILISCAIISCYKMFKRRNYMEQIDIDIPGDKYNTNSLSA